MKKSWSERKSPRGMGWLLDDEEPPDRALYDEYVHSFDAVPVLDDVVALPPRRVLEPNFVRGERRSLRREERLDGYLLRESGAAERERHYDEYTAPPSPRGKRKKQGKAAARKRGGPRRRKAAAGG